MAYPTSAWNRRRDIFDAATIKPAVVHVESHPYLPQWDLLHYCKANGIVLQAFAALGHNSQPKLLEDPVILAIASASTRPRRKSCSPGPSSAGRPR